MLCAIPSYGRATVRSTGPIRCPLKNWDELLGIKPSTSSYLIHGDEVVLGGTEVYWKLG